MPKSFPQWQSSVMAMCKKVIERYLQELAAKLSRVPTEADVLEDRRGLLREIDLNCPNRGAAFKQAKIVL